MTQRRNYFVQKSMQSKFILTLILLLFLVAVISLCNVWVILEFVRQNQGLDLSSDSSTKQVLVAMGPQLLLIGVVNIIIVAIIGVFYSHQFAGPSFKIERSVRQMIQGDLATRVTLRQNDAFQGVADSLNELMGKLCASLIRVNEISLQIKTKAAEVVSADGKIAGDEDAVSKNVKALVGMAGEIQDLLAAYRLTAALAAAEGKDAPAQAPVPPKVA